MSSNDNLITKKIFDDYKEEQRKLMNKKNRTNIVIMIIISLILSGITGVASYTLAAGQVGYTARDTSWTVDNTQDAIDELRDTVGYALVGSIFSYMGNNAPFGYLACDGTEYNIADYPRLAEHFTSEFGSANYFGGDGTTTFKVPDLRGEFLRGTGTATRKTGTGLAVGVHQDPTYIPNVIADQDRLEYISANTANDGKGSSRNTDGSYNSSTTRQYRLSSTSSVWESSTAATSHYSSRPTNTAVLYIIKY